MINLISRTKSKLKKLTFKLCEISGAYKFLVLKFGAPQIIMYHRVCSIEGVASISEQMFEEQILFLKENFNIVPIEEFITLRKKEINNRNIISITFDDGYKDFYQIAWPIIKKHSVPASLYVATDFLANKCWLWPDKIRVLLKKTGKQQINIEPLGKIFITKKLFKFNWDLIGDYCLKLSLVERNQFLDNLERLLEVSLPEKPIDIYSSITDEQLKEMSNNGLDIGSHTVTHPILSKLESCDLEVELESSKCILEKLLDKKVHGICYPNGMIKDIDKRVLNYAEKIGYSYGLMAYKTETSNIFKLGRVAATNRVENLAFELIKS